MKVQKSFLGISLSFVVAAAFFCSSHAKADSTPTLADLFPGFPGGPWFPFEDCGPFDPRCTQLLNVTSDYPVGYRGIFQVLREDGQTVQIDYLSNLKGDRVTPGFYYHQTFTVEQLHQGGVLIQALGMDMLSLQAPEFDSNEGGRIRLDLKPGAIRGKTAIYFDYDNQRVDMRLETPNATIPVDGMRVSVSMVGAKPTGVKSVDFINLWQVVHTMKF